MRVIKYNISLTSRGEKPSFYIDRPTFDKLGIHPHELMIPGWYHEVFRVEEDKYYTIRLDKYAASYEKILNAIEYLSSNGYTLSEDAAKEVQKIEFKLQEQNRNSEKLKRLEEERKIMAEQEIQVYRCNKYGCLMKSTNQCKGCRHKILDDLCEPEIIKIKKGEK